ncbi:MAG: LytR/AlgR family response regulator transcription factor [Cyclobacteriaceae bacterium]
MRITLIDDEASVRETIGIILRHHFTEVQIAEANSVAQGVSIVKDFKPDLVFLDIEMGDGTGFDLLTRLDNVAFPVVFVTAHDHYAIKAIKFSALDYILKPADPEEIVKAVKKAAGSIARDHHAQHDFLRKHATDEHFDRIVLSDQSTMYLVKLEDIISCKAEDNYTQFMLSDGRELVISRTLKHYDELLNTQGFVRVHQSYLINLHHLDRFDKREGGELVMKNGSLIPVASRRKEAVMEALRHYKAW